MKYPFRVYQIENENVFIWIAESTALKGCVGQGSTIDEALNELAVNESEWLKTANKYGMNIPDVPIEAVESYSGKVTARMAPYVHKDAVENARRQGISLNQYINDAIVAQNSRFSTINQIMPEVKSAINLIKGYVFDAPQTSSAGENNVLYIVRNEDKPYKVLNKSGVS